jgi:hypothetical protein
MSCFAAVTDTLCAPLGAVAHWFGGCSHRRTSFPITMRSEASRDREHRAPVETYIVCLACGRHFAYDWSRMRIASPGNSLTEPEGAGFKKYAGREERASQRNVFVRKLFGWNPAGE